jgi:hypothetical protein
VSLDPKKAADCRFLLVCRCLCVRGLHQIVTLRPNCRRSALSTCDKLEAIRGTALAYKMIAERENETIKIERKSSLVIVAKAKVWASEGWHVVITDVEGRAYAPAEFDRLLAA